MGVNRKLLYWGTFFMAMGGVVLLADYGAFDNQRWDQVWRLWPLAVIGLGVALVLRRTRLSLAGGMLMAALPGVALGGAIAAAPNIPGCGIGEPGTFATQQGAFAGPARVDVTLTCGELAVNTASGSGWQLQAGNTSNVAASVAASPTSLVLGTGRDGAWFGHFGGRDVWRLTLPTAQTMDLTANVEAGEGRLNLGDARLGQVALTTSAGSTHLDLSGTSLDHLSTTVNAGSAFLALPAADDFDGTVSVNAGSLKICAPPTLGLRIQSSVTLGSARYPTLVQSGGVWESPDYATAGHRAALTVNVNLGSVDLNPVGGCL